MAIIQIFGHTRGFHEKTAQNIEKCLDILRIPLLIQKYMTDSHFLFFFQITVPFSIPQMAPPHMLPNLLFFPFSKADRLLSSNTYTLIPAVLKNICDIQI
jgi:hypothetical protein